MSVVIAKVDEGATCSFEYASPVGRLKIIASAAGICAVKWMKETSGSIPVKPLSDHVPVACGSKKFSHQDPGPSATIDQTSAAADGHLSTCVEWLDAYFTGTLLQHNVTKPPLVLDPKSDFFLSVWTTLASTGVGERLTYKQLAKLAGHPGAARAVGQAVRKHNIPILVPCHRVIRSGRVKSIGNYSGGQGPVTKEWLLEHERTMMK